MSNIIITNGKNINTANGSINAGSGTITTTGSLTCGAITTNNNTINAGSGTITSGAIITSGSLTCGAITTNNNNINAGSGTITSGSLTCGSLTCGAITTNNNNINAGNGTTTTGKLSVGTIRTNYSTYPTYDSSYIIGIPLTAGVGDAKDFAKFYWFNSSSTVDYSNTISTDGSTITFTGSDATFATVVFGTYMVVFNTLMFSNTIGNSHYLFIIRLGSQNYCVYQDNTLTVNGSVDGWVKHISITKIVKVTTTTSSLKIGYGAFAHNSKFTNTHLEVCKIG
jgi:hypothetical protein